MIISASRRTDIPAFYTDWFIERVRVGYCEVPNPYNPSNVSHVSLKPECVDLIVFWTRNPSPLFPHFKELDAQGYRYYFLYTVMDNPRVLDPLSPSVGKAIKTLRALADLIGPEKIIWRYDPIVFTRETPPDFHMKNYEKIGKELRGYTRRSIISVVNLYKKTARRLKAASVEMIPCEREQHNKMMTFMAQAAGSFEMDIFSCAQESDLAAYGIEHGKCIDDRYIWKTFGLKVTGRKDPSQRKTCCCVASKDVGVYDSCLFGCVYCYATASHGKACQNHHKHDPKSAAILARYFGPGRSGEGLIP